MKIEIFFVCLFAFAHELSAQTNQVIVDTNLAKAFSSESAISNLTVPPDVAPNEFTNLYGVVYKNVKVLKHDPIGLTISHNESGSGLLIERVPFQNLPESIRNRYTYKPENARDYSLQESQGLAALTKNLLEKDKIRQDADIARRESDFNERQKMESERQRKIEEAKKAEYENQVKLFELETGRIKANAAWMESQKPPPQTDVNVIQQQQQNLYYNPYYYNPYGR